MELAVPHKVRAHWRRAVNKVDRVAIKADVAHLHRGLCERHQTGVEGSTYFILCHRGWRYVSLLGAEPSRYADLLSQSLVVSLTSW
jgi:hypothetical protein